MADQYTEGAPVKRALLELAKFPLYDQIRQAASAVTSTEFFSNGVGTADTTAINAANKSYSDTNMRRAGSLATPTQFEVFALSFKYADATSRADFRLVHNAGNATFRVGEKNYLRTRNSAIPGDCQPVIDQLASAADGGIKNGWSMSANTFDLTIAEELYDEASERTFLTGRRVPIFIPSEQEFGVTQEYPGGVTLGTATRLEYWLWGTARRAVQ